MPVSRCYSAVELSGFGLTRLLFFFSGEPLELSVALHIWTELMNLFL